MTFGVIAAPFREAACESRKVWRLRGADRLVIEAEGVGWEEWMRVIIKRDLFLHLWQSVSCSRLFCYSGIWIDHPRGGSRTKSGMCCRYYGDSCIYVFGSSKVASVDK